MNLKDCYLKFGGDFDEVLGRLRREQTVRKFVFKFLDDKSFSLFEVRSAALYLLSQQIITIKKSYMRNLFTGHRSGTLTI